MHHGGREITVRGCERGFVGAHQSLGDGQNDVIHARVHKILKENFLRPFLLVDARIVRQIIGHCLVAVAQVSRAIGRGPSLPWAKGSRASRDGPRPRVASCPEYPETYFWNTSSLRLSSSLRIEDGCAVGKFPRPENRRGTFRRRRVDDVEFRVDEISLQADVAVEILVGQQRIGAQPAEILRTPDRPDKSAASRMLLLRDRATV